jgi:hypothetical protein
MAQLATVCPGPGRLSETGARTIDIGGAWQGISGLSGRGVLWLCPYRPGGDWERRRGVCSHDHPLPAWTSKGVVY